MFEKYIMEAAEKCQSLTSNDEEEIMGFNNNFLHHYRQHHDLYDNFCRSPELRVGAVTPTNLVLYDAAVQELKYQKPKTRNNDVIRDDVCLEKVSVQKTLEQLERYQLQIAEEQHREKLLYNQRVKNKKKPLNNTEKCVEKSQSCNVKLKQTKGKEEEKDEEELPKINVRELIQCFEQQCIENMQNLTDTTADKHLISQPKSAEDSDRNCSLESDRYVYKGKLIICYLTLHSFLNNIFKY